MAEVISGVFEGVDVPWEDITIRIVSEENAGDLPDGSRDWTVKLVSVREYTMPDGFKVRRRLPDKVMTVSSILPVQGVPEFFASQHAFAVAIMKGEISPPEPEPCEVCGQYPCICE